MKQFQTWKMKHRKLLSKLKKQNGKIPHSGKKTNRKMKDSNNDKLKKKQSTRGLKPPGGDPSKLITERGGVLEAISMFF